MEFEERAKQMVVYAKYRFLVQRSLAYNDATLDNLELVYYWSEQLPSDPSDDEVAEFTDGANKKLWFESLRGYFALRRATRVSPCSMTLDPMLTCLQLIQDLTSHLWRKNLL